MTWAKIDDQFHAHPKVIAAWQASRAAVGLHLLALSHACAYLTDGHVSEAFVKTHLPTASERRRAVNALLDAGLWERNGSGWVIHDYHDFNESREAVLKRASTRPRPAAGTPARATAGARVPTPIPYPSSTTGVKKKGNANFARFDEVSER